MSVSANAKAVAWRAVAVGLGLVAAGLVAAAFGASPADFYKTFVTGAFGSVGRLLATLTRFTPLLLAGVAVAVPLRGGLYNIGAQGQMYAGALASVAVALSLNSGPAAVTLPLALTVGAIAGALWGGLAGLLKSRFGVHEVISTIMLNFVAWHGVALLVHSGPLAAPENVGRTPLIPESTRLPVLASSGVYDLSSGILIGLAAVAAAWWLVSKSVTGFRMRAAGGNPLAASRKGISVGGMTVAAMALGGAFAGLGGAVGVTGAEYAVSAGFSQGAGFDGIAVALLAGGSMAGLVPSALLFAALRTAATILQRDAGVSSQVTYIVEAIIIIAAAVPHAPRLARRARRAAGATSRIRPAVTADAGEHA